MPVCLSAGIGFWFLMAGRLPLALWIGLILLALAGMALRRIAMPLAERGRIGWTTADAMHIGGMAVMLIVAGAMLGGIRSAQVVAPVLQWRYYGQVEGRVVEIDRSARDRMRLTLDQVILRDIAPDRTPERVRLSLMQADAETLPPLGQRIMLTGHLGPPPGPAAPGSFDFRQFAWFQRLGAVGYSRTPIMSVAEPQGWLWSMHHARMRISAAVQRDIGGQEGAVAAALMTGDRSGIEESTNEIMRASNLYHIVSISGLHMSMLTGFVYTALRLALVLAQGLGAPLPQGLHKIAAFGALLAAAAYLWLSGGGVATERSFVMVAVMLAAIMVDRRAISLRTIALAATIILIYSPEALTSPGFQMSFAATVALILAYGPWSRLSPHLPWWLRPVAMLLVSSLVASLATSPIAAAHFNRMAHYGLIANLLSVPIMGALVMPAGAIAALLAPFGLQAPALWAMGVGTKWMLLVAGFIADLGGAVTAIPLPPAAVIPLMGFGATLMVLTWRDGFRRVGGILKLGFGFGLAMLACAAILWITATRPQLLIAGEGDAVGLMTPEGRAVSKPTGGGFVIENWLLEDGDMATQRDSADRAGWGGSRNARHADLPGGWQVWHFSGKGAAEKAVAACQPQRIVVVGEKTSLPDGLPCLLYDLTRLRQTGAVAIDFYGGETKIKTVAQIQPAPGG